MVRRNSSGRGKSGLARGTNTPELPTRKRNPACEILPCRPTMKSAALAAAICLLGILPATGQDTATVEVPDNLKPEFEVLNSAYPKVQGKRAPIAPADSAWMLSSNNLATGTVEVGFEKGSIVYMIFRRGVGGEKWTLGEIKAIHLRYHKKLLKEDYNPKKDFFTHYAHTLAGQINAALITKKNAKVDLKEIRSGL